MSHYIVTINGHEYAVDAAVVLAAIQAALAVYDGVYRIADQRKLTIKTIVRN